MDIAASSDIRKTGPCEIEVEVDPIPLQQQRRDLRQSPTPAYASKTDYQSLYTPSYFGKGSGASSFTPDAFTREILAFCSAQGLQYVVDVGSGSGALAAILRSAGIRVLTCDFDPVDTDSIHFDLSGPVDGAARVLKAVRAQTAGEPWLVTCLDVLEHLDVEDVFSAVRNLRAVCCADKGWLIASISTRPSSADNKFHATILPKPTWLEILRRVGFFVNEESIFQSARTVRREFPEAEELKLVSYWAKCDLFRDIGLGEPDYVLLSTGADSGVQDDAVRQQVEALLDIAYRREKRLQFNAGLDGCLEQAAWMPRVALNLHHIQEFVLYRPLLDVLPRKSVTVLIRSSVLDADALSMARGFFARCGVQVIFYERCVEIAWRELDLQFLITGAESNVTAHHVMGRQVVEAAKLHGVHTIQMQHGIWIEQFPQRLVEFGSETIWAWNAQYERFIHESRVSLAGKTVQGRRQPWQKFALVGCPKFVDVRLCPPQDLLRWRLGVDTGKHRAVALLGTNLLWHRHTKPASSTRERLVRMMQSMPDVYFIVKLHPSERAANAAELNQPNSLVLDDILMGMLDLHVSRLIAAVDVVISSLSTLLLDAAVGGKPCVQYSTGNDLAYQGQASVEIEQLPRLLMNIAGMPVNTALVQAYGSPVAQPFYEHLARTLATTPAASPPCGAREDDAASYYSVATEVEGLWEQVRGSARALHAAQGQVKALSDTCATAAADLSALQVELQSARASEKETMRAGTARVEEIAAHLRSAHLELAALRKSNSWRWTAPLRTVRRLLRA